MLILSHIPRTQSLQKSWKSKQTWNVHLQGELNWDADLHGDLNGASDSHGDLFWAFDLLVRSIGHVTCTVRLLTRMVIYSGLLT